MGTSTDALELALQTAGFDVFSCLRASWYNDYIRSLGLATDEDHVGGKAFSLAPLQCRDQCFSCVKIIPNM